MKRKTKYTNEPINAKIISDFLPPPDQLIFKEDSVKVTLTLSRNSIDFFKKTAKKNKVPYQRMMRNLLDSYARHFKKAS